MLPELTHWPVNWADGMKISRSHLIANDNALRDAIRDATGLLLTSYNYGLLSSPTGQESPLLLTCDGSELTLSICRAITPGGARIDFDAARTLPLRLPLTSVREQWQRSNHTMGYIVLDINPFEPQPCGQPDPEEVPLRYPYTQPTCRLSVLTASMLAPGMSAGYHLPIGKLLLSGGQFSLDSTYLPPCRSVGAWPAFRQHHQTIGKNLGKIADFATTVIGRVRTNARSGQANLLASSIGYLAEATVRVMSDHLDAYDMRGQDESPLFIIELGVRLARTLKLAIKSTPDQERDTMFNYFKNWCNVSPAEFETSLQNLLEEEYLHADCQPMIDHFYNLTDKLIALYSKLSELNYVEKERGTIYQEKQELDPQPTKRKGIWG